MPDKTRWIILLIFITAFLSRLLLINNNQVIESDELSYVKLSQNIADGLGFSKFTLKGYVPETYRMPFLPIVLSFVSSDVLYMKIMMIFLGSALVLATFALVREILDSEMAVMAAVVVAFNFQMLIYSVQMMTEILFSFFLVLSLFILFRTVTRDNLVYPILLGIFSGIFSLMRYNGIYTFLIILFYIFISKKEKIRHILIATVIFFVVMSPFLFRNLILFGNPLFASGQGVALWIGNNPKSMLGDPEWIIIPELNEFNGYSDYEINSVYIDRAIGYIMSDWYGFFYRTATRFLWNWINTMDLLFIPMFFLFILGIFLGFRDKRKYLVFYLILSFNFLLFSIIMESLRYLVPFIPIMILFGFLSFKELTERIAWKYKLLIFLILILVLIRFSIHEFKNQSDAFELFETGKYINGKTNETIIARMEVGFYANVEAVAPNGNLTQMIDVMKEHDIEYLVIDSRYTSRYYTNLLDLLDAEQSFGELEIERVIEICDEKTLIFRLGEH